MCLLGVLAEILHVNAIRIQTVAVKQNLRLPDQPDPLKKYSRRNHASRSVQGAPEIQPGANTRGAIFFDFKRGLVTPLASPEGALGKNTSVVTRHVHAEVSFSSLETAHSYLRRTGLCSGDQLC